MGARAAGRRVSLTCRVLAEQAKILVAEAEENNLNLALALRKTGNKPEAKELLRARIPVAERSLGREHYGISGYVGFMQTLFRWRRRHPRRPCSG